LYTRHRALDILQGKRDKLYINRIVTLKYLMFCKINLYQIYVSYFLHFKLDLIRI